jgi:uncharacterized membrane-anchored protein
LADQTRLQSPDLEPSLADGEIGAKKASTPLLIPAARWERPAIAAAVAFQLLVLVGMILGRTVPYFGGRSVLLQVVPVDPRDLFRGDYVTLGYDISRPHGGNFQPGQTVYAMLIPDTDGRHYHAGPFLHEPPASGVFIQGTAQGMGLATYGIESYYVQEGAGHDYEDAVRNHRLWAEIVLDGQGKPSLRRLVIE